MNLLNASLHYGPYSIKILPALSPKGPPFRPKARPLAQRDVGRPVLDREADHSQAQVLRLRVAKSGRGPHVPPLLAQDLLDPRDRLVDRLLGADAVGGDAMHSLSPDALPLNY